MQSSRKTRSNHFALQLKTAASTITSLEENKAKAEKRIAKLEVDVREAKEWAEEMQENFLAVTIVDKGNGKEEENEEEEGANEKIIDENNDLMLKEMIGCSWEGED